MEEVIKRLHARSGGTDSENEAWTTELIKQWRDLTEAEKVAMMQLDDIREKLVSKDSEISILHADIKMLGTDRDNKILELEALTNQLRKLREENEVSFKAVKKIEKQLEDLIKKNCDLTKEVSEKSEALLKLRIYSNGNDEKLRENNVRIRDLETSLLKLKKEIDELNAEHEAVEEEREEEFRALQNALDDALEQKIKIQAKYEQDFLLLRNSFSQQEQQVMDDFEWKLRQIELACKAKLSEKDKQTDEKIKEVRGAVEREMSREMELLAQDRRQVDEQMRQVLHYKSYEVELIQLRGLIHEQQRSLRSAARQLEHHKFNEKVLHEEIRGACSQLDKEKKNLQMVQSNAQRRLEAQEENLSSKFEKQKNELNSKWEDRMRDECSRLKQDLCRLHAEEKHLAVESMKLQKDQEFLNSKHIWEKQLQDYQDTISKLKDEITESESENHREVEKLTAVADRENWELRRKIDKINNAHEDLVLNIQEKHLKEISNLQDRCEILTKRLHETERKLHLLETTKVSNENSVSDLKIPGLLNQTDSGCGDDSSDEVSDEDDEEDEDLKEFRMESDKKNNNSIIVTKSSSPSPSTSNFGPYNKEADVNHLREEVASLQGSIEKLTSELSESRESKKVHNSCNEIEIETSGSEETSTEEESEEDE